MQVRAKVLHTLDATIALSLAMLMIGIAIGSVAYGESWVFWTIFLGMGICHAALLAASRLWSLLLFFFLLIPGWLFAYVVCDLARSNPASDFLHAIHESGVPLVLFGYSLVRAIWEFYVSESTDSESQ